MLLDEKIGVLLVNLGTPNSPSTTDVRVYLNEFLTDPRVIDKPSNWLARQVLVRGIITPFRAPNSAKSYREIWTDRGSPLKFYGEDLCSLVQTTLDRIAPNKYIVKLSMRYQQPDIDSGLMALRAAKVSRMIVLPLFPQYASASTGSVQQRVMEVVSRWQVVPDIRFIRDFYANEGFIDAFASIGKGYMPENYDYVLFSFHGLPQRQMQTADDCNHCLKTSDCCSKIVPQNQFCYSAQCHATAHAIAQKLGLSAEKYGISYQSRLGNDPWLLPYTVKVLEELAGKGIKKILVFCPAFVADCLETIFEISEEYQADFTKWGGEKLQLVESLNTHPKWVSAVCNIITQS